MFNFFRKKTKNLVGIDFGSFAIKAVEISRYDSKLELKNYGILYSKAPLFSPSRNLLDQSADFLKTLIKEAGIKTKKAVVSLPVFTTFSTMITLELKTDENLSEIIKEEAKKYIPVSLNEVALDWIIINKKVPDNKQSIIGEEIKEPAKDLKEKRLVFVVAVPKEIINQYNKIIKNAELELVSLEAESFSLLRSLIRDEKGAFILVDWGVRFVNISVVDNGFLYLIHNISLRGGDDVSLVLQEIERTRNLFWEKYQLKAGKCILSGGGANDELVNILTQKLGIDVAKGNPFSGLKYSSSLENVLGEIGPQLTISTGLAMRKI